MQTAGRVASDQSAIIDTVVSQPGGTSHQATLASGGQAMPGTPPGISPTSLNVSSSGDVLLSTQSTSATGPVQPPTGAISATPAHDQRNMQQQVDVLIEVMGKQLQVMEDMNCNVVGISSKIDDVKSSMENLQSRLFKE